MSVRRARPEDVDEICRRHPGTCLGTFFTIEHFRRSNSVLVRQSRLGELTREELREVITEAWPATAPKALVAQLSEPAEGSP